MKKVEIKITDETGNVQLYDVIGSMFTNDELCVIKTDILHIYDKVSLDENQVHKRNLILNKIKIALAD